MHDARASGWTSLFGSDPVPWLLASADPSARWLTLTRLLDRPLDDSAVVEAHVAVLDDLRIRGLIARLPDWETDRSLSGHDSPDFAPNLLGLLADLGIGPGDSTAVDRLLDVMLRHQDGDGRFASYGTSRMSPTPAWGALLCDTHAITDVLVRFGRVADSAVARSVARISADRALAPHGTAWTCIPCLGFRGPGRVGDVCPQVTVEALRAIGRLPRDAAGSTAGLRSEALEAARTMLAVWRMRATRKPYMFGHGMTFKTVKWPPLWYSVLGVVDALGRYPELWRADDARDEDRRSLAELAACLVAYNVDADGRVTPRSCYRGFEAFSFGQKKEPSPFATALVASVLRRLDDLADEIAAVDVRALGSSKGGTGTARPPRSHA